MSKPYSVNELVKMDGKPAYWKDDDSFGIIAVENFGPWEGAPFFRGRKNGCNFEYDILTRNMAIYPVTEGLKNE